MISENANKRALDAQTLRDNISKKKAEFSKTLNNRVGDSGASTAGRTESPINRDVRKSQIKREDNTEDLLNKMGLISKRKEGR